MEKRMTKEFDDLITAGYEVHIDKTKPNKIILTTDTFQIHLLSTYPFKPPELFVCDKEGEYIAVGVAFGKLHKANPESVEKELMYIKKNLDSMFGKAWSPSICVIHYAWILNVITGILQEKIVVSPTQNI